MTQATPPDTDNDPDRGENTFKATWSKLSGNSPSKCGSE